MWYVICDMWYVICEMWYVILDTWYLWYVICDMCYVIWDMLYVIPDTWYLIPDMWYVICYMWHLIPDPQTIGWMDGWMMDDDICFCFEKMLWTLIFGTVILIREISEWVPHVCLCKPGFVYILVCVSLCNQFLTVLACVGLWGTMLVCISWHLSVLACV